MRTRSSRRTAAGAAILVLTAALSLAGRALTPPYIPEAPEYRTKGPKDAPVTIAEFSDFQCPACAAAAPALKQVEGMFPGKIRFVFKHLPWDFHPWAGRAAIAAECAGRQGRFWDYHDRVFETQPSWSRVQDPAELKKRMMEIAGKLGLEEPAFEACFEGEEAAALVAADRKEAEEKWIRSTPTILINGRRFVGAQQLRTIGLNHIENELKGKS